MLSLPARDGSFLFQSVGLIEEALDVCFHHSQLREKDRTARLLIASIGGHSGE
jgi:hypothetical protein